MPAGVRSTTRSMAPTPFPRRTARRRARATTRCAAPRSSPGRAIFSTRPRRSTARAGSDARGFSVADGKLAVALDGGRATGLKQPEKFAGYLGDAPRPASSCCRNNGIHIEVLIDASSTIGKGDPAHISDVWLELALTTIQDFEDSIAAVDAEDKVAAYRNWLGLMKGDLRKRSRRAARPSRASSTRISTTPRPTARPSS